MGILGSYLDVHACLLPFTFCLWPHYGGMESRQHAQGPTSEIVHCLKPKLECSGSTDWRNGRERLQARLEDLQASLWLLRAD